MGDVKLGIVMGLALGWGTLWALYLAAVVGAAEGTAGLASGRWTRSFPLPFAPFIAAGTTRRPDGAHVSVELRGAQDPSDRRRLDPDSPSAGEHPLVLPPITGPGSSAHRNPAFSLRGIAVKPSPRFPVPPQAAPCGRLYVSQSIYNRRAAVRRRENDRVQEKQLGGGLLRDLYIPRLVSNRPPPDPPSS